MLCSDWKICCSLAAPFPALWPLCLGGCLIRGTDSRTPDVPVFASTRVQRWEAVVGREEVCRGQPGSVDKLFAS